MKMFIRFDMTHKQIIRVLCVTAAFIVLILFLLPNPAAFWLSGCVFLGLVGAWYFNRIGIYFDYKKEIIYTVDVFRHIRIPFKDVRQIRVEELQLPKKGVFASFLSHFATPAISYGTDHVVRNGKVFNIHIYTKDDSHYIIQNRWMYAARSKKHIQKFNDTMATVIQTFFTRTFTWYGRTRSNRV